MAALIAAPTLAETLPQLMQRAASERAGQVALREKRLGIWRSVTYADLWRMAGRVAGGLAERGFARGDVALIISSNRVAWVVADMAILRAGGVSAATYPSVPADRIAALVRETGASVLAVEDEEQLEKALAVRRDNPAVKTIVLMAPEGPFAAGGDVVLLDRLAQEGPDVGEEPVPVGPDDVAIIGTTSGSTGRPRAVPLSNRNICFAVSLRLGAVPARTDETQLSMLPLALASERIHGLYAALATGTIVHFPEGSDTLFENLREVEPTSVTAIPRVWERFYSNVTLALAAATPLQRFAYRRAIAIGRRVAELRAAGRRPSPPLAAAAWIGNGLVLNGVRQAMGLRRARWLMSTGAPISDELTRWYASLGLPVLQVYGQAETAAAVAMTPLSAPRAETVGRVMPGVEVKTSADGEILVRSAGVFAGYAGDATESDRVLTDGWFRTGDVGELSADGYLTVVDRMKNAVVMASGTRLMPSRIENRLNLSPYIADTVVFGHGDGLACLVLIDYDHVVRFAQDTGVPFTNFQSLCRAGAVTQLIGREIARLATDGGAGETIARFGLIDVELAPGDDELTPAIKLRRALVEERFKGLVEARQAKAA